MYTKEWQNALQEELTGIRQTGRDKVERLITGPQSTSLRLPDGREVLNLCANNYLGLADHPEVKNAAAEALETWGFGMASVRFICGTQSLHKNLEDRISRFLGTEDTILYSSCFDANGGLFETLLGPEDAVISDSLNHASIIDGIRLCKAARYRYANGDMVDLEKQLQQAASSRFRLVVTDGVFSMDGYLANLPEICDLAKRYEALVVVDDSHAVGVMGRTGAGTPEHFGLADQVDVITGTLGKALGGGSGGYVSGRKEIVALLRQRSRPYLFSNSLAPPLVAASLKALDLLEESPDLLQNLHRNASHFRKELVQEGLEVLPGHHPIIPIMVGDSQRSATLAEELLKRGIYVVGFSHPVVPHGQARLRTQVCALHTGEELAMAARIMGEVFREC